MSSETSGNLEKNLHSLLVKRIYHEDQLFTQRIYNFVTANAFLAVALGVSDTGGVSRYFTYSVILLGYILAILQVFLGERTRCAIAFWRKYVQELEKEKMNKFKFDHAWSEFFSSGKVEIFQGTTISLENFQPVNKRFVWRALKGSATFLLANFIPWLFGWFWGVILVAYAGSCNLTAGVVIAVPIVIVQLYLAIYFWRAPDPKVDRPVSSNAEKR